jgi:ABC-type bacteriocin/lantibiotic exporter with double-glycine peptidase domain
LAGAYEFISKLDEGFATPMEESGHRFSSGECKRIAIAALFLNKPSVLLLDEPTSDLDMEAEKALAATLKQLSSDHTIILVTHSPLLLRVSDSVMLMQQGKIRAAGATSSMLEKLGLTS